MSDAEWQKFFDLVQKIVDLPGMTWGQKKQEVLDKAGEHGADSQLGEFLEWFKERNTFD